MVELEDRILPYSVAIDLSEEGRDEDDLKSLFISFSYPNINALGKSPSQDERVYIISTNANSIFEATNELSSKANQTIYLKHLNVLILSQEVASNEDLVREIFDGLQRDFITNKMINIVITKEEAHQLLAKKLVSTKQETVEGLLVSLLRNGQKSTSFTPITLMEFIKDMDHKRVAVVPVALIEPEIAMEGGGLFKDYKFIGYIDKDQNRDIAILNNKAKNEDIDFKYKGSNLSLALNEIKSKKKLIKNGEVLRFQYSVEMDGQIHQYVIDEYKRIETVEDLNDIEKNVEEIIEEAFTRTIERLQKDLNADALGLLEYLYKFHPKIHEEVKDDWDNIFPYVEIDIDVEVNIRRRGLSQY